MLPDRVSAFSNTQTPKHAQKKTPNEAPGESNPMLLGNDSRKKRGSAGCPKRQPNIGKNAANVLCMC